MKPEVLDDRSKLDPAAHTSAVDIMRARCRRSPARANAICCSSGCIRLLAGLCRIGLLRRAEPRKQVLFTQLDDFDAARPGVDPDPGIASHQGHRRAGHLGEKFTPLQDFLVYARRPEMAWLI